MNFNRDLLHNIDGRTVKRTFNEAKNAFERIADDVGANASRDVSRGVAAEEAMGRASFSMLKGESQAELSQKMDIMIKKLRQFGSFDDYYVKRLNEACTVEGRLDERFVGIAEDVCALADRKPEGVRYVQEAYVPEIVELCKAKDGNVDKEIYGAVVELMRDDCVSTRGVPDIINGCKEYLIDKNGNYVKSFNKSAFEKWRSLPEINHNKMWENDDCWTLYMGEIFDSATRKDVWTRKGEECIFDEVAFNFAKRLYEQRSDIIHMSMFMKQFHHYVEEGGKQVSDGFKFIPDKNSIYAPKMIENLIESIKSEVGGLGWKDGLDDLCKVDGEYSLHNLLVADTLVHSKKMGSFSSAMDLMSELRGKDGLVPTDAISYLLRSEKPLYNFHARELKTCMRSNGTVDGYVYNKLQKGDIYANYIDQCRDANGEIIRENIDFLEFMYKGLREHKYNDYQIREAVQLFKNKDGILDVKLLSKFDELLQYTHLAPEKLAKCMIEPGVVDETLFALQKDIQRLGKDCYNDYWKHTKNADGSLCLDGVSAVRKLLDDDLLVYRGDEVISTFKSEKGIDLPAFSKFVDDNKHLTKSIYGRSIEFAHDGKTKKIDLDKFNAFKDASLKPEVAPLIEDYSNVQIVRLKLAPEKLDMGSNIEMYNLAHITPENVEILERNGYPARFYRMLAKGDDFMMSAEKTGVKSFEERFISGPSLEEALARLDLSKSAELNYSRSALGEDIKKVLDKLPENQQQEMKRSFNISFDENAAVQGFPRLFESGTNAPTGRENAFEQLNTILSKFYLSGVKSESPELKAAMNEIIKGFPEFSMVVGKIADDGSRVDIGVLKQLSTLVKSPEYRLMSQEDKTVSKMAVLMNSLGHVDDKSASIKRRFMTDNDGIAIYIDAEWGKTSEYANAVLNRYNLSEKAKYRITSLLNDLGWSKKLKSGELDVTDVALNQRHKGDEVVSPLLEKVILGEKDVKASGVPEAISKLRQNQQVLMTTTMKELEPYIETAHIYGRDVRYVDLSRPELKDSTFLTHFLGYDNLDHTLNLFKDRAYRSGWSASLIKGGNESSQFAGRSCGIVLEADGVNVANAHHSNIESGFGKQYDHLKESLLSGGYKDIKHTVKKELNLSDEEYGLLMEEIIHSRGADDIADVVINGRRFSREEIIKAHKTGLDEITSSRVQNEATVVNPVPVAVMGVGESINDYFVRDAVNMAHSNDLLLLLKKKIRQ